MEPYIKPEVIRCYPKLCHSFPPNTISRSLKPKPYLPLLLDPSTVFVLDTMAMMNHVHHVALKMEFAWTDDNSPEGPKCRFFIWNDDELEEGYYKDQLHKMRFELRRKEDHNEVTNTQKKLVKLQQDREAEKEVFDREFTELKKENTLMKTYLGTTKCLILFFFCHCNHWDVVEVWLKCS
ncbi:unnamed protein product [Lactuca saligna]|uniref:Uncharacterized protein n=1 Tax=Lactuca saligna TaxID=75948 RepID=A0AA35ZCU5_LACSI|nr:unnamed protein product [Lactuca saligna]